MGDAPKATVMQDHGHGKWPSRPVLLVLLAGLIILGAVIGVLVYNHNRQTQLASQRAALVSQAIPDLSADQADQLAKVVNQIKKVPGYDKDPDSLYIITRYYISVADGANAKSSYDKLIKAYTSKGYTNPQLNSAPTPTALKQQVEVVENLGKGQTNVVPLPTAEEIKRAVQQSKTAGASQ